MGYPLIDPADPRPTPPRFSMRRLAGFGLLACLCLWTPAGALMALSTPTEPVPAALVSRPGPELSHPQDMPPADAGWNLSSDEATQPVHAFSPTASVLAKRRSHASPSPTATPEDSPAAGSDTGAAATPAASPGDATSATPEPEATPSGTPSPAFMQKFEAATVQFLQKDYVGAKKLLDEADAIQPHQPNSVSLRNQIFKQYYETAYADYQHADYADALTQLDGADGVGSNAQNQSDAYNLRGLVLSKQRNYEGAEGMFRKAVQTDPGLWAAKFNYAEVPFNYRNFTVARSRFEELLSQTDPAKQPVEAELTQFKVFLTLLLEGKEDAARTFMQHFNFSGATPARYFCQAALNFYSGDVDKAQGWIDSARKEYPARKSSSFLEAFYRVGWLTDPNGGSITPSPGVPASALAAAATPAASPAAASVATPVPTVAVTTTPVPIPGKVAAVSPAVAAATPVFRTAVPLPTLPPASPPIAAATPAPSASKAPAVALATPVPTASKAPAVVAASPVPSASKVPAMAVSTPKPAATSAPVVVVTASPLASATPPPIRANPAPKTVVASPTPASTPVAEAAPPAQASSFLGDAVRVLVVGLVLLYFLYVVAQIAWSVAGRKPRRLNEEGIPTYNDRKASEADKVETPR